MHIFSQLERFASFFFKELVVSLFPLVSVCNTAGSLGLPKAPKLSFVLYGCKVLNVCQFFSVL